MKHIFLPTYIDIIDILTQIQVLPATSLRSATMVPSLNHVVRLVIALAPIIAMVAPQASPSGTDVCANGHFIASCAYPGLKFVDHTLGMYCLNDNTAVFGYNWTW